MLKKGEVKMIHKMLKEGLSKSAIARKVEDEEPLIRFETDPGVQMQVDWIEFRKDGLSAFVATMGYSRAS